MIVLHRSDCFGSLAYRRQYLVPINHAYNEIFESMDEYKHENNFKRILNQLTLSDVRDAINRSRFIMQCNKDSGYILHEYKGFKYYKENPSLDIWEAIERIFMDCKLI